MAVQEGHSSIRVSWTPSTGATGYIISYDNDAGSGDHVTLSDGSTNSYLMTGLEMDSSYTISIVAISQHLPSDAVQAEVTLGEVLLLLTGNIDLIPAVRAPEKPTVDTEAAEIGATTISLSWTVPDDSVVTGSLVMWELSSSGGSSARAVRDDGSGSSELLDGNIRSYTIRGLQSSTSYNITVILINPAGNSSMQVTLSTTEGNGGLHNCYHIMVYYGTLSKVHLTESKFAVSVGLKIIVAAID